MFRIFKTQDRTIKITVIVSIDLDMFKFYQFYYFEIQYAYNIFPKSTINPSTHNLKQSQKAKIYIY